MELIPFLLGIFVFVLWSLLSKWTALANSKRKSCIYESKHNGEQIFASEVQLPVWSGFQSCSRLGSSHLVRGVNFCVICLFTIYVFWQSQTVHQNNELFENISKTDNNGFPSVPGVLVATSRTQRRFGSVRMSDPDGDAGWYYGALQGGQAHGDGELKYDEGSLFVGIFVKGIMWRGVAFRHGHAKFCLDKGHWLDGLDTTMVEEFTQQQVQSQRMSDVDGDAGRYSGSVDVYGRAHGQGELKYDEGAVFIGWFFEGSLWKGIAYMNGHAHFSMDEGSWHEVLDQVIVEEFPMVDHVQVLADVDDNGDDAEHVPHEAAITIPLSRQRVPITQDGSTIHYKSAYYGTILAGNPAVPFNVVFDTGSGHLILPSTYCSSETCRAHRRYRRSQSSTARDIDHDGTSVQPGQPRDQITVSFGTGEVTGVFVEDVICLDTPSIPRFGSSDIPDGCMKMSMIVAMEMSEEPFKAFEFDGVLGLGLTGLSQGPAFNFIDVVSAAMQQTGSSLSHTFGVFLAEDGHDGSEITLGGWSQEHLAEQLRWNPVSDPEYGHWTVQIKHMRVDGMPVSFCASGGCKAVVDTGTSLLAVPTDAFAELYELLRHTPPLGGHCRGAGPHLHIRLASCTVSLGPEDYSRLEEGQSKPNTEFDALQTHPKMSRRCRPMLMTMDLPEPLGPKLFILGEPVLRKYYTAYDVKAKRIGFGRARHNLPLSANITAKM